MSLEKHIENVFTVLAPKRGWKTIYWLVDVHGVIIPGSWAKLNEFRFISEDCFPVLKWLSDRADQRIIVWTSSHTQEAADVLLWLERKGIHVDYFNHNPEEKNTEYADFSQKPYFNILIDDKAGFDPNTDWKLIRKTLERIGIWDAPLL